MRVVHELFHSGTGDRAEIVVEWEALTLALGDEHVVCASTEALVAAYQDRLVALLADHGWRELDGNPVRLRDLTAMRAPQFAEELPAIVALHERLVNDGWGADLAEDLEYTIGLHSGPVAAGGTKVGGRPDLPAGLAWPGDRWFLCQLDLASLAPFDVGGWLPHHGVLYVFVSENCTDNVALYAASAGPPRDPPTPRVYTGDFREQGLVPSAMLRPGAGDGEAPPDDVLADLSAALGLDVAFDDAGTRVFGTPDGELRWSALANWDRPADLRDPATFVRYDGPLVLVLQVRFASGWVYVAVPPGDLVRGDFSQAVVRYWGT